MKTHLPQIHQEILRVYLRNLCQVRGLSPSTCRQRFRDVRLFLQAAAVRQIGDLSQLGPTRLVNYLSAQSRHCQPASLRNIASSVRDFLRFARQQGWTSGFQELGVPKIACGARNDLPVYLSAPQLDSLLAQLSILGGFWKKCASTVRRFLRKNAVIDLPEAPKGL